MVDILTQTQAPTNEIDALVTKHRPEIDRIKIMSSQDQQQAFRDLGVDPQAVAAHYPELQRKSAELQREDSLANKKTAATGIASLVAGTAGAIAFNRKRPFGSKIVQRFVIPITGLATGFAGTFVGSRLFSGKIRDESKKLTVEAKNVFERELAVALENKERESIAAMAAAPAAAAPSPATAVVPQRDASFAAQAVADKAAADAAIQRT
jgi:hypothetical protein